MAIDEYKDVVEDICYVLHRMDNKYSQEFSCLDRGYFNKVGNKLMNKISEYDWLETEKQLEVYNKSLEETLTFKKQGTLDKIVALYNFKK